MQLLASTFTPNNEILNQKSDTKILEEVSNFLNKTNLSNEYVKISYEDIKKQ